MFEELEQLDKNGIDYANRLFISDRAHLVSSFHMEVDGLAEERLGETKIGTTRRGIGPTYASKALRFNMRVGEMAGSWEAFKAKYDHFQKQAAAQFSYDKFKQQKELDELRKLHERMNKGKMIVDTVQFMHEALNDPKKRIIAEGANATMLDMDFGTYPFVTSSSTTIGGVVTGLGIPPHALETNIGIVKAYTTRVGSGPFPTELEDETGVML